MSELRQSVAQTLADVISWRPVLEPVLRAFEPALAAQAELAVELPGNLEALGFNLPEWNENRAGQGASLLAGVKLAGIARPFSACAAKILPLLGIIEAVAPHAPALEAFFAAHRQTDAAAGNSSGDSREALAVALVSGDHAAMARIAEDAGLEPPMLGFVSEFALAPVLRAITHVISKDGEGPWNDNDLWRHGYCPVCGAMPSIAWLDKPALDEKNAYLAGGGGKKLLHCGLCGANWRFRRGACPSCEKEGNGVIEILRESGPSHGERLDWCTSCKSYCPTVDLREREFRPNLEAAAIGMMHLDMVAARKKLRPLKASFWNIF